MDKIQGRHYDFIILDDLADMPIVQGSFSHFLVPGLKVSWLTLLYASDCGGEFPCISCSDLSNDLPNEVCDSCYDRELQSSYLYNVMIFTR